MFLSVKKKDNKSKFTRNKLEHETQTPSFLVSVNPKTTARFSWCFHLLSLSTPHTTTIFSIPPPATTHNFSAVRPYKASFCISRVLYPDVEKKTVSTGHRLALRTETINLTHDVEPRGVNLPRGKLTYYPCLIGVRLKEPPQDATSSSSS